jgi:hypothetical protein
LGHHPAVKQSRLMLAIEAAYVAYMLAVLWFLFPQWHGPILTAWRASVWRWQRGRDQVRFQPLPLWIQEAAQVRGRFEPTERAPRPLNLPI